MDACAHMSSWYYARTRALVSHQVTRSVSHLATVDQTEVCPLSRGMMSQSLSGPLQPVIRFLRHPLPASSTAFLAGRLPAQLHWQRYGLTVFPACHMTDVGSAFPPAVLRRRNPNFKRVIRPHTVLVNAYQQLWHRPTYEVYQQFTSVNRISQPSASTPLLLGVSEYLFHNRQSPKLRGLHCQRSFTPHRCQ
ncbi:hypothetical protein AWB73_04291 [Caballeronia turbans]|jgi:hypothetical protein|nr:hypothetical protein AWB73_04291 [Caballeronia turbans]